MSILCHLSVRLVLVAGGNKEFQGEVYFRTDPFAAQRKFIAGDFNENLRNNGVRRNRDARWGDKFPGSLEWQVPFGNRGFNILCKCNVRCESSAADQRFQRRCHRRLQLLVGEQL